MKILAHNVLIPLFAIACCICLIAFWNRDSLAPCAPAAWPNATFSAAEWKESKPEKRYRYVNSFLSTAKSKLKNVEQLKALLGAPDSSVAYDESGKIAFNYLVRKEMGGLCLFDSVAILTFLVAGDGALENAYVRID